jgi:hypothetical protein
MASGRSGLGRDIIEIVFAVEPIEFRVMGHEFIPMSRARATEKGFHVPERPFRAFARGDRNFRLGKPSAGFRRPGPS